MATHRANLVRISRSASSMYASGPTECSANNVCDPKVM